MAIWIILGMLVLLFLNARGVFKGKTTIQLRDGN